MPAILGQISALGCRILACTWQAGWGESSGGAEKFAVLGAGGRTGSDRSLQPRWTGALHRRHVRARRMDL